jgi:hypothetical protein
VCSSNQNGMTRVITEPGAANPRTMTTFAEETPPSAGSRITKPVAGIGGPIVPTGIAVGVGLGLGVGVGVGVDVGVGVGVCVGVGVGVDVGLGVGTGLGDSVTEGDGEGDIKITVGGELTLPVPTAIEPVEGEGESTIATFAGEAVGGIGGGTVGPGLIIATSTARTARASPPTPAKASQSRRALDRLGRGSTVRRGYAVRRVTPVRCPPAAGSRSGLAMGSAGYSRTVIPAVQPYSGEEQ